jgi:hypothetical protein
MFDSFCSLTLLMIGRYKAAACLLFFVDAETKCILSLRICHSPKARVSGFFLIGRCGDFAAYLSL